MTTLTLTESQASAVEIYVTDPAVHEYMAEVEDVPLSFELIGRRLRVLTDIDTACAELIEASNSADCDGPGAGGRALMNLARKLRRT
jgi:predicted acetyltransferase